jgi:hypothetical protein
VGEDPQELYRKMAKIDNYQREIAYGIPFIFFEHCFEDDILDDTVSIEEKEFMENIKNSAQENENGIISYGDWHMKNILSKFNDLSGEDTMSIHTDDDIYDEYLQKYMIPCLELPNI